MDSAIGGYLSQRDSSNLCPVAFYSRKLSPTEENYDIYDKELLAIVECLRHWRVYLEGAHLRTRIYSDHQNLERFATTKVLNRRQARWAEMLGSYNFEIVHRPGKDNTKADLLSRRPDYFPNGDSANKQPHPPILRPEQLSLQATALEETFLEKDYSFAQEVKEAYETDPVCKKALELARAKPQQENHEWTVSQEGLLLKKGLIYIPNRKELRARILHEHHDEVTAGHQGRERTKELVSRNYDFENMDKHVRAFVDTCDICSRSKPDRHKPYGVLKPLSTPLGPWESITMDFIVKLPPSADPANPRAPPYDSILVVVDRFTKMAHFIPCYETTNSSQLAHLVIKHVIAHHGTPTTIISDRGKPFISKFTQTLYERLGIKPRPSTAFHPQTDGQTERMNQTIEQYLRAYCNYQQDNWVELLPLGEFCLNNAKQTSTGQSPFYANYGRNLAIRIHLKDKDEVPAAEEQARTIARTHEHLKGMLEKAQKQQAKYYDRRRAPRTPEFATGSKTWLRATNIATSRPSAKLDDRKLGPFEIIKEVGTHARHLKLPPTMKIHPVFHISMLEPYKETPSDRPARAEARPVIVDGEDEWEVDEVVDSRWRKRGRRTFLEYKVRWANTIAAESSWEPAENLEHAKEAVQAFHQSYSEKPGDPGRAKE